MLTSKAASRLKAFGIPGCPIQGAECGQGSLAGNRIA
jgi:hypothetical protein